MARVPANAGPALLETVRKHRLRCYQRAATLVCMITTAAHITMMMVMEMPSPGHFAMPRNHRVHGETGRLR
ncbi:hypothetical protein B5F33_03905 [Collinsella sp. An2]|nr:hypothetical protein B5F33_03905 [Collinsella sp. An2]